MIDAANAPSASAGASGASASAGGGAVGGAAWWRIVLYVLDVLARCSALLRLEHLVLNEITLEFKVAW